MSIFSKMTAIADEIRAKTGKSDKLTLDDMASEIASIESGIDTSDATATANDILSGKTAYVNGKKITGSYEGVELNFDIKRYNSEEELLADTPAENTIGVVTTTPITDYTFSATQPSTTIEGCVWISIGTSSSVEFNALKKNAIQVYPISAKQYVSGTWVNKTAQSYQGGAWVGWTKLPITYQEVEYIQTTGDQWIDTGITPSTNKYRTETEIECTSTEQEKSVFGTAGGAGYYHITIYNGQWYYGTNGTEGSAGSIYPNPGKRVTIVYNKNGTIVVNGSTIATGKTIISNHPILIATRNNSTLSGKFKYFYFRIVDNDTEKVLLDLVPCYRRSDSVAGMYDLVSNKFFTNSGSGTFMVGGDVI